MGDTIAIASQQHKISGILRESRHQEHLEVWKRATDQGRCATHISLHPSSNHWLNTGNYLSFSAYNVDETGMPLNHRAPKVVTQKGQKKVRVQTTGDKSQITVVGCASATGQVIPPYVIFDTATLNVAWTEGEVPGTTYGLSKKGWIDTELFYHWLQNHFLKYAVLARPLYYYLMGTVPTFSWRW